MRIYVLWYTLRSKSNASPLTKKKKNHSSTFTVAKDTNIKQGKRYVDSTEEKMMFNLIKYGG